MEESTDGAMKILLVVLLLSVIGCESAKQKQDRIDAAQKSFNQVVQDNGDSELDRKLRDSEIVLFSQRYGEQSGTDLLFCEHNPPRLEKNKAKCRRLEAKFEKFREYRKAHSDQ
jgi:hypothetical protein